ncbi:MAG: ATP-binding protein [Bacteroidota bacterium]|nr:ATP-binding protein [Bacteroidota bacterium]
MEVRFKTRARTLDMLGRQQIAGVPTAISELFKNAYDAGGDCVEVDYFRSQGLFILRDNGSGMDRQEFLDRWFTIAAKPDLNRKRVGPKHSQLGSRGRQILGEKGIGRLAIATIAPQVLVLTRALLQDKRSNLMAAFVNWRAFEDPGLNMEDIRIPLQEYPSGTLPDGGEVRDLVRSFLLRNEHLKDSMDTALWDLIQKDLGQFTIDPNTLARELGNPSLLGDGHGTHFFLLPASDDLDDDIDGDPKSDVAPPLQRALLGFTTPSFACGGPPVIKTAFRDHRSDGSFQDLIGEAEFFSRDEYENADHQVTGEFDSFGQFLGDISIYGETKQDHVINWGGGKGRATGCGPFSIRFAAIEGAGRNSTLPPHDHSRMLKKTRRIGGLYIYRDGVRIQPYGNTDYDWLEIELRRTKSAAYYYFSYRQMFGVVSIDSDRNKSLSEKAGREGFRENKAYRDFRSILKNFLIQIAADFFRRDGPYATNFVQRREELAETYRHEQTRAKKARLKVKKFQKNLDSFFEQLQDKNPLDWVLELEVSVQARVQDASRDPDRHRATNRIREIERDFRRELTDLEAAYRVTKPRVGLSKALGRQWNDYLEEFDNLRQGIRQANDTIDSVVADEMSKNGLDLDARDRLQKALENLGTLAKKSTWEKRHQILSETDRISADSTALAAMCVRDVDDSIRKVMTAFAQCNMAGWDQDRWIHERSRLEERIRLAQREATRKLESALSLLTEVEVSGDSSIVDQLAAIEQSNIALKEQAAADRLLTQTGMAIEIISHEFGAAIRSVRSGLQALKSWADVNPDLVALYQGIRGSFDHLDGYLSLFTPLQRRLYRKAVNIRGWEIHDYLMNLFGQRLTRHRIDLSRTETFAKVVIQSYPSSIYPVFINLVDNSIYWLSGQNDQAPRRIRLDADGETLLVSDTGPGIHARDRAAIFESGFTRKPGGRGMGLYIAKETLREAGYELILAEPRAGWTAVFAITPKQ